MINIIIMLLKEIVLSMLAKLTSRVILERFMTRLVVYGLNKLKSYSSNNVVDETVTDIIEHLKGRKLKLIDEDDVK